jgi:phosphate transport system permease protein
MALSTPADVTGVVQGAVTGKRRDVRGPLFAALIFMALLMALVILAVLLADVALDSLSVWETRSLADFLTNQLSADPAVAGIWQALVGSILLMAIVGIVALPTGVASAVYLEEYATDNRFARIVNANIRNLAGVPSIVYGLLGLALFAKALGSITGPDVNGRSLISGGLTLSLMVLPIVIITASEALRAVPGSIREAAFGVGATPSQVIRHHVLPVAAPGILTGTILSLGRAFGEAAPLIILGGVTTFFQSGADAGLQALLQGRFSAMPVLVFRWVSLPQEEFRALTAALIVVMLAVLLLMNATAIYLRNRYEQDI